MKKPSGPIQQPYEYTWYCFILSFGFLSYTSAMTNYIEDLSARQRWEAYYE